MKWPMVGPLDHAVLNAVEFSRGMAEAYFIDQMLKQMDSLTALLEQETLDESHRKATEILLEQLETTFFENIVSDPAEEPSGGRKNF
jgi:hypothetical protein